MDWSTSHAHKCKDCHRAYAKRKPPQDPPCFQCRPPLMEENEDASNVYQLTRLQFVTAGMGQPIDIDIKAVKIAMDLFEVKNQLDCIDKVRYLFHYFKEDSDNAE